MSKTNGQEPNPREVKLSDGRTLTINLNQMSWHDVREYVAGVPLFDPADPAASDAAEKRRCELMGKGCSLPADEVAGLGFEDWQRIAKKMNDLIVNPVETDPN